MLSENLVVSALALAFGSQAMGAVINKERGSDVNLESRIALIATDPVSACNCPNNCSHKAGSSCKYYSGPSDSSAVLDGSCADRGGTLICIV